MFEINIGSSYFFNNYDDYILHDTDILRITPLENNINFTLIQQYFPSKQDLFLFNEKLTKQEYIDLSLKQDGLVLGKFLIPEFCNHIGFSIEDLKQLTPLLAKLKEKHFYEKIIFNAYLSNGDFFLTKDQRDEAYALYKKYRKEY